MQKMKRKSGPLSVVTFFTQNSIISPHKVHRKERMNL
jgi:hypothetical protein